MYYTVDTVTTRGTATGGERHPTEAAALADANTRADNIVAQGGEAAGQGTGRITCSHPFTPAVIGAFHIVVTCHVEDADL